MVETVQATRQELVCRLTLSHLGLVGDEMNLTGLQIGELNGAFR
jgi:hypothetical protein